MNGVLRVLLLIGVATVFVLFHLMGVEAARPWWAAVFFLLGAQVLVPQLRSLARGIPIPIGPLSGFGVGMMFLGANVLWPHGALEFIGVLSLVAPLALERWRARRAGATGV